MHCTIVDKEVNKWNRALGPYNDSIGLTYRIYARLAPKCKLYKKSKEYKK